MRKRGKTRWIRSFHGRQVNVQLVAVNLISKCDTEILLGNEFNNKESLKVTIDLINLIYDYINYVNINNASFDNFKFSSIIRNAAKRYYVRFKNSS